MINLSLKNIPASKVTVSRYLVDATHSNSYTAWKNMGSPQEVSAAQFSLLEKAARLQTADKGQPLAIAKGIATYQLSLAGQGVMLLKFAW